MIPDTLPQTVFHTRQRNPALGGDNPFEWRDLTTTDIFAGKRSVVFALPGAFTPACSESHLPGYEENYDRFTALGIDQVVCIAVNDAFVMYQWARSRGVQKVMMLPDGNGDFTRLMGMLVDRSAQGLGQRSWRYAMLVDDCRIVKMFIEPDLRDNPAGVPMTVSGAQTMLDYLRSRH